ncbi:homoserine kinase [Carnobacterium divergens]|uniref:Homoserine kinase n=1 Tax=Carnobacterium divergens TaxID=2748 RepID=A0A7Z8CYD5_CARDV|nr:homoserine kinase [Carnobacterium divergens]MPQ21085.1 homoserine kinase [Carnobacterium divergens]TFI72508.1 homoserine kinase [Carnobacterium divergens]TFI76980.1 homoserine kinase [Carnobacterium divergens]TFI83237.1 homoserine kinase [Carnobacterium divergens]TFI95152.1 homoserine kinase [Carnobacterium divergens]
MQIRVPGTTANLGPGFDSCGLALNLYLTLTVGEVQDNWEVIHSLGEGIPMDQTNVIVTTACKVCPDLEPRKLWMTSEVPSTRGLGSSSAAIVAGIELANQLGNLMLSQQEKVTYATLMEGHPDNVAPAILGDFVVATKIEQEVYAVKHSFPATGILVCIPNGELLTSESRDVLPQTFTYSTAVTASSIANVMISAILANDLSLAGKMMEQDLFHEYYRKNLIPHLSDIRETANQFGAYGTFLSGAGPTVLTLVPLAKLKKLKSKLERNYPHAMIKELEIERNGVEVIH